MLEIEKIYSEHEFVERKTFQGNQLFGLQFRHWAATDSRTFQHSASVKKVPHVFKLI